MLGLALFTLAVRWPYRSNVLWSWDSALYALGVEQYDINAASPHPPGSPVYIFLGRLFVAVAGDANTGLVALSMVASAAAVALLYGFMREIGSIRAALAGAFLFLFSPVFFLNGLVALAYANEAPLAIGLAWLAWRIRARPTVAKAAAFGALAGIAIGIRQSLLFTLTPLMALGAFWPFDAPRRVVRRGFVAAGSAIVAGMTWLIPMLIDTGVDRWIRLVRGQSHWVFDHSVFQAGWAATDGHLRNVQMYLDREAALLPTLAVLVGIAAVCLLVQRRRPRWDDTLAWPRGAGLLMVVWLVPPALFTMMVHSEPNVQNSGYVLAYVPALYALYAWVADAALRVLERVPFRATLRMGATLAAPALLVIPAPALAISATDHAASEMAASEDRWMPWLEIDEAFKPEETAILTEWGWYWFKWYLPENTVWMYWTARYPDGRPDFAVLEAKNHRDDIPLYTAIEEWPNLPHHAIAPSVKRIVLGESFRRAALLPDIVVQTLEASPGFSVDYFEPTPDRSTIEEYLRPL